MSQEYLPILEVDTIDSKQRPAYCDEHFSILGLEGARVLQGRKQDLQGLIEGRLLE